MSNMLPESQHRYDPRVANEVARARIAVCGVIELKRLDIARSVCTAPRWLRLARERLVDSILVRRSSTAIAHDVGIHPVQLSRAFHQHFGTTASEFLRSLRVACTAAALVESRSPIAPIAYIVGFGDQAHLTRTFKRYVGMSPRAFRIKKLAEEASGDGIAILEHHRMLPPTAGAA